VVRLGSGPEAADRDDVDAVVAEAAGASSTRSSMSLINPCTRAVTPP
jgi:hypothetical protein